LQTPDAYSIGGASRHVFKETLEASSEALAGGVHQFFSACLGGRDIWRAWPDFRHSCVYLDIETDGFQNPDSITTIGLYDGKEFRCLVKGEDLGEFHDIISHYSMIVTFFGNGFDIPMLKKAYPSVQFDHLHLDLCPTLRQLGYKGGLKKIEKQVGIARGDDTDGLSGYDAVLLWRRYLRGDDAALETLISYNREDVVNLERLAELAFGQMERMTLGRGLSSAS
jgi:hypothetical protein